MRSARHVARIGRGEVRAGFWWGDLREYHLEDPCIDARIILKFILKKWDGVWAKLIWLRIGRRGSCECGNEPSVSIYCGKCFFTTGELMDCK
jgi:hypothetical protein